MVRYLFYTIRDLTYQSPLVAHDSIAPNDFLSLRDIYSNFRCFKFLTWNTGDLGK